MQLYFIRHGQSDNNAFWDLTGGNFERSHDPGLTESGLQQAILLGSFLSQAGAGKPENQWDPQNGFGFGLTHLYSSLMLRAVATGTVVANALGLPLVGWLEIHESGGIYLDDPLTGEPVGLPGNTRSYFETNYPNFSLPESVGEEGWWNRPFEARPERRGRARRVVDELWRKHGNTQDRVAIFSHGGFYNHFISTLFNIPLHENTNAALTVSAIPEGRWMLMNNGAISRIDFLDAEVRLVYQNRTDFLPRELIT